MNFFTFYKALETKAAVASAALWVFLDLMLGGIDAPIKALCVLMIVDFASGVGAAWKKHKLNSTIGANGLWKKVAIFFAIGFACLIDMAMGMKMLRGMVISGFAIIEALSILENIDKIGWGKYLPVFISSKIKDIAEKNIDTDDDDDAYVRHRKKKGGK